MTILTSDTGLLIDPSVPAEARLGLNEIVTWVEAAVAANSDYIVVTDAEVPAAGGRPKAGLIVFEFLDRDRKIVMPTGHLYRGKHGHFLYLEPTESGQCEHRFSVPERAVSVRIGLALWHAAAEELRVKNRLELKTTIQDPLQSEAGSAPTSPAQGLVSLADPSESGSRLQLTADPVWTTFRVPPEADLRLTFDIAGESSGLQEKAGVVWLEFYDVEGHQLRSRAAISSGKNGDFVYLDARGVTPASINVYTPRHCATLKMGLAAWKAEAGTLSILPQARVTDLSLISEVAGKSKTVAGNPGMPLTLDEELSHDSYLRLRTEPSWLDVSVEEGRDYRIGITVDAEERALTLKSGLIRVEFYDVEGSRLSGSDLKVSELMGEYIYIDAVEPGGYHYDLRVPVGCQLLRLGFQTWHSPAAGLRMRNSVSIRSLAKVAQPRNEPTARRSKTSAKLPRARELKVAVICDEFTYNSFKYEFRPVVLEPETWQESMERHRPDIFFCESAWSGVDSERRPWKGQIYASSNFKNENRTKLLSILDYCREFGIPTVFWNKEDPSHYEDRVHDFAQTASLFDYVFTTDQDCVDRYKSDFGIEQVACLPFATQPRLFNPSRADTRTSDVVFAGSWYANHAERSQDMATILDSIIDAGFNLDIYDRYYGTNDELHVFPERFRPYTRPAVSHSELAEVYKSSLFGLNINTVTDSSTMFARRVFELMSSNTVVISNYARGLEQMFGSNIVTLDGDSRPLRELEDAEVERMRDENLHRVLDEHTYAHRFRFVLDNMGFRYRHEDSRLSLVCVVAAEDEIRSIISKYRYCADVASRLVLVLDEHIPDEEVRKFYTEFNRLGVVVVSRSLWRKQGIEAEAVLGISNFALVDVRDFPDKEVLRKAALHLEYVDGPIAFGSTEKYVYETRGILKDIIAPSWYLTTAILNAGEEISGSFYHV